MCLPFTVRVGEGVGRYVVATRDIKAGQVILMIIDCHDEHGKDDDDNDKNRDDDNHDKK